jgi:hypothetical protein
VSESVVGVVEEQDDFGVAVEHVCRGHDVVSLGWMILGVVVCLRSSCRNG